MKILNNEMKNNILFITNQIVYPPSDGGKKIALSMIMNLHASGNKVVVLSFNLLDKNEKEAQSFFFDRGIEFIAVKPKNSSRRKKFFLYVLDYFFGMFSKLPRYVQNRLDPKIGGKIKHIVDMYKINLIYLDSLWISEHVDSNYYNVTYLIEHNIEYILSKELAKCEKNPIKKILYYFETLRIYFYEKNILSKFPNIIFLSSYDKTFAINKFKLDSSNCILNNNKIFIDYSIKHLGDGNFILFTGSLLFLPNLEGLLWFLRNCYSTILSYHPNLVLKITGAYNKKIKNKITKKYKNVIFTGFVSDEKMKELLTHCKCIISPILSGSGIKIKNLEAIQLGIPIVMTEFSARGIDKVNENKIKFCKTNTPEEFTFKLLEILDY